MQQNLVILGNLNSIAKEYTKDEKTCVNTETLSTLEYMSPETLNQSVYYKESDIYSFGVLAYELLLEKDFTKLNGYKLIVAIVNDNYRPDLSELDEYPDIRALIEKCWKSNWKARPNFEHICSALANITIKHKFYK